MITWKEVAIGFATLLVAIVGYLYVGLESKVDDQAKQLIKISKQVDIVVSILSKNARRKFPSSCFYCSPKRCSF